MSGLAIIENESASFLNSHLKEIPGIQFKEVNDTEQSHIIENKWSKPDQFLY